MLKIAALLFNTLTLLIYHFLFADAVTVVQSIPTSAKAGSEFTVELTINKGAAVGFAKLQQELPAGFTAVEDKNSGAAFTFSNQTVKFIWMSLPNDHELKLSYKVKVAAGISGAQTIAGKFSYVSNNDKQTTEIEPSIITIGEGGDIAAADKTTAAGTGTDKTTTGGADTDKTTATGTGTDKTTTGGADTDKTITTTSGADATPISIVRNAPSTASDEFIVEVTLNKGNISGFAKLVESLPSGFTASAMESAGASFSFADQKARFIWVTLPTEPEFKISYKVNVQNASGDQIIEGLFSYIDNEDTKKYALPISKISISAGGGTQVAVKTDKTDNKQISKLPPADVIPPPQGKIIYHVQILALHKAKSASVVGALYNINPSSINPVMEEGFRKYLVGSHNEYKEARDARETFIPKGVVGPFVTAYNKGKRVTVQEALMVSNQKWYR